MTPELLDYLLTISPRLYSSEIPRWFAQHGQPEVCARMLAHVPQPRDLVEWLELVPDEQPPCAPSSS